MPPIGFSTGALFRGDVGRGVTFSRELQTDAIELSALRVRELDDLIGFADITDLSAFRYVSVHAPTDFSADDEAAVANRLRGLAERHHWFVVVHPDTIRRSELWRSLGRWLCIENMDKRKPVGRTMEELSAVLHEFPEASLCFDIAHAHQVDPTMTEAYRILRQFSHRLCQLHVSEVTSSSKHERISEMALQAYWSIASQIPNDVPVILESPVEPDEAAEEIAQAERIFTPSPARATAG